MTSDENEKIRIGLLTFGNNYAKLKSLYFKQKDVDAHDIANHCASDQDLNSICKANKKNRRKKIIQNFRDNQQMEIDDEESSENDYESESGEEEERQCECRKLITTPTYLNNGNILIPNKSILRESA